MAQGASADHEAEADEGYFASVSDLMVGILFVFLLMLTVFAINLRDAEQQAIPPAEAERLRRENERLKKENAELRGQIAKLKAEVDQQKNAAERRLGLLKRANALLGTEANRRTRALAELLAQVRRKVQERDPNIAILTTHSQDVLRISGDVLFESGSWSLNLKSIETIKVLREALADVLPCYTALADRAKCGGLSGPILEALLIEGHTDDIPFPVGGKDFNDELSTKRALTVFDQLMSSEAPRLRNLEISRLVGVAGYGPRRPAQIVEGLERPRLDEARRFNRRIDLRFILSTVVAPDVTDLKREIEKEAGNPAEEGR